MYVYGQVPFPPAGTILQVKLYAGTLARSGEGTGLNMAALELYPCMVFWLPLEHQVASVPSEVEMMLGQLFSNFSMRKNHLESL